MSLVSEIHISALKSKNGELVAFANFTICDAIRCNSVAILRRLNGGYRLLYPTKKFDSRQENYFFPISLDVGREIERTVVAKYKQIAGAA